MGKESVASANSSLVVCGFYINFLSIIMLSNNNLALSNVYKHKYTGQFICYNYHVPETKEHRSLRILRRSMNTYKNDWNIFITLTYASEYLRDAKSDHIRKFLNVLKQKTRNKLNKYEKDPSISRAIINRERQKLRDMRYVWKIEFDSSGQREVNPHFHLLLDVKFWLKLKLLHRWWKYGNIDFQVLKTPKKAKIYITKYFRKETKNVDWAYRKWGKSRNLKTKVKSEWKFYSTMFTECAMELSLLTKDFDNYPEYYQIRQILKKNQELFRRAWELQLVYFQLFKSKLRYTNDLYTMPCIV